VRGCAYLEAVDGEEAAEDALLEPRAEHDHIVLLIHGGRAQVSTGRAGAADGRERDAAERGGVGRWRSGAAGGGWREGVKERRGLGIRRGAERRGAVAIVPRTRRGGFACGSSKL
jgi:hypothetical protein